MLHIVRTVFLWREPVYQRIGLQNHGDRPASFDLTLSVRNDFADLFEVRGETPAAPRHRFEQAAGAHGRAVGI